MTIGDFIKKLMEIRGLSTADLVRKSGIPQPRISEILSGKTKSPQSKTLIKLSEALEFEYSKLVEAVVKIEGSKGEIDLAPEAYDDSGSKRPASAFDIPRPSGRIPIISWAQAGPDGFFEDSFPAGSGFGEINRPYDVTDPNAYALTVIGDSMVPKYEPGDVILVSPNMGVQTGDYAVVRMKDGTVMAKRVKFKNDHYFLESVNTEYEPVRCSKEDIIFMHRIVWVKQRG